MPTKLTRIELLLTKAQLDDLGQRFPWYANDKERIYYALGFEPPQHGGKREGAGMKPKGRKAKRNPKPDNSGGKK